MDKGTVSITDSKFYNNSASVGGSLSLECSLGLACDIELSNNEFINNTASGKGGAVYFNMKPPLRSSPSLFLNNKAPYGNNIASYPFDIIVERED